MPTPEMLANNRRLREALMAGESFIATEATERFGVAHQALPSAARKLEQEGYTVVKEREGQSMRYRCADCAPAAEVSTNGVAPPVVFPYPIIGDRLEVDFIQRGKTKGTVDIGLKAPDGSTWLVQVVGRTT